MLLHLIYPQSLLGGEPGKVCRGFDPAETKTLLAEAGHPKGFTSMIHTGRVDPRPVLVPSIQADLRAVGIDTEIKTMDRATYNTFSSDVAKSELGTSDRFLDFPDPVDWVVPFFTLAHAKVGGQHTSCWVEP